MSHNLCCAFLNSLYLLPCYIVPQFPKYADEGNFLDISFLNSLSIPRSLASSGSSSPWARLCSISLISRSISMNLRRNDSRASIRPERFAGRPDRRPAGRPAMGGDCGIGCSGGGAKPRCLYGSVTSAPVRGVCVRPTKSASNALTSASDNGSELVTAATPSKYLWISSSSVDPFKSNLQATPSMELKESFSRSLSKFSTSLGVARLASSEGFEHSFCKLLKAELSSESALSKSSF